MNAMPFRSDRQLQQDVLRELENDTRASVTEIGVQVTDGVVTLTGIVDSWAKKAAAQEAAHRVIGVLDVANDIHVRRTAHAGRTDTDIAGAVRRALEWDAFVPDGRIESTVSDGVVTLAGVVDHIPQREDAERAVRSLEGVVGVVNQIQVVPPPADVTTLHRNIEEALERRAAREARGIRVSVAGDVVTLEGRVRSWAEKRSVVGAATGTPGVRHIVDEIEIDPTG